MRGWPGSCWSRAGCPECWIPPAHILECRALLQTYHELREAHTGWVQRIHAVLFHQGAPSLAGSLHTERRVSRVSRREFQGFIE
jgi:hypothetical protein